MTRVRAGAARLGAGLGVGATPAPRAGGVGGMSRRRWRRLERHARADHERQTLLAVQRLAAAGAAATIEERHGPASRPGVVVFRGAGWRLVLVGASWPAGGTITGSRPDWRVTAVGRHGRHWWVRLADDDSRRSLAVLAFHLHLADTTGGEALPGAGSRETPTGVWRVG